MLYSDLKLHREPGSLVISAKGASHSISINTNTHEVSSTLNRHVHLIDDINLDEGPGSLVISLPGTSFSISVNKATNDVSLITCLFTF